MIARLLSVISVVLLVAQMTMAAPAPSDAKNAVGPTIVVQVKSIDHLLSTLKTAAKSYLPDVIYQEFEKEGLSKLDPKLLQGVDPSKPSGLYATVGEGILQGNFATSNVVALVPIASEKDFIQLLEQTGLKIEKNGDLYTIPIPDAPVAASLRFFKGYAYIGISADKLDVKSLLLPQDVINDKETAAAVLRVRVDRIPNDIRQLFLKTFREALDKESLRGVPAEQKDFMETWLRVFSRWIEAFVTDTKEFTVRVDLDPKTGTLLIEQSIEPTSGSAMAKSIASLKPTTNEFASIVSLDSAAHVLIQTPLFIEDIQTTFVKLVDVAVKGAEKEGGKDLPKEARELINELFGTVKRTVQGGRLDFAACLRGPDKDGQYTAVGAFSLKESAALEKAIKAALKVAPKKDIADLVKVDVFQVGDVNVHEIDVRDLLPPEAQKVFSKSPVYVAFAPNAGFVTFGSQAKEAMKEVLTSKPQPKPAPLVQVELSGKRLMTLLKNAGTPLDGPAGPFFEKFAKMEKISLLNLHVAGGEKLVIRTEYGFLSIMSIIGVARVATAPQQAPIPIPN